MEQSTLPAIFKGEEFEFYLPSGRKVKAKEPSGADEELLSKASLAKNGDNLLMFIASVTLEDSFNDNKPPTKEQIAEWKIRDKYYFLLKFRILYHGKDLTFNHIFSADPSNAEVEVEEDLSQYLLPHGPFEPYNGPRHKTACQGYSNGNNPISEFAVDSIKFRFKHMTSTMETAIMASGSSDSTKNSFLLDRKLEVLENGNWREVTFFNQFSGKQTSQIRKAVKDLDEGFSPAFIQTSADGKYKDLIEIFSVPTFYYPEEMM